MITTSAPVRRIEGRKLQASPVARVAGLSMLILTTATSVGGYAAAVHAPTSDLGRKAATMINGHGWEGYVGLAALGLGICVLLAGGIVSSWTIGREFTDGTIVGLFAVATSRASVARAKIIAYLSWGSTLVVLQSTLTCLGGLALALPPSGVLAAWATVSASGLGMLCSVLPVTWVSTRWRGYLPGIGATLILLVVTNLAAGFGLGRYIPWAIPTLWAAPNSTIPTMALVVPITTGLLGAWATHASWSRLELGRS